MSCSSPYCCPLIVGSIAAVLVAYSKHRENGPWKISVFQGTSDKTAHCFFPSSLVTIVFSTKHPVSDPRWTVLLRVSLLFPTQITGSLLLMNRNDAKELSSTFTEALGYPLFNNCLNRIRILLYRLLRVRRYKLFGCFILAWFWTKKGVQ